MNLTIFTLGKHDMHSSRMCVMETTKNPWMKFSKFLSSFLTARLNESSKSISLCCMLQYCMPLSIVSLSVVCCDERENKRKSPTNSLLCERGWSSTKKVKSRSGNIYSSQQSLNVLQFVKLHNLVHCCTFRLRILMLSQMMREMSSTESLESTRSL